MLRNTCFAPLILAALLSCQDSSSKNEEAKAVPVEIITIERKDVPIVSQFVGQARSSRQVEIRARVDGFLDKIAYEEGALVKPGQILFQIDPKPYEANLQQAKGELALQQARLFTADANLKRIRPLAEKDAVSKKDLDDAIGAEKAASAAVLAAEGGVREAELNLGYATIFSPLTGLASKAIKREGSYIPTGPDSLLTYVAQLDPIWVNFSISENQILATKRLEREGLYTSPPDNNYDVEAVLSDGSSHPYRGKINFAEPNIDPETGTFLLRAVLDNPKGSMRPGQFVRVRLHGAKRNHAIVVPQTAVLQGAKGHFVWIVDRNNKAAIRSIQVGPWQDTNWFIDEGLNEGDRVIITNLLRLRQDLPVKIEEK